MIHGSVLALLLLSSTSAVSANSVGRTCGTLDNRCCGYNPAYWESGYCKDDTSLKCWAGTCLACGADGQPACPGGVCKEGTKLKDDWCVHDPDACGVLWNKCCNMGLGGNQEGECNSDELACTWGQCKPCGGGEGEKPCAGSECDSGLALNEDGLCVPACGLEGNACCHLWRSRTGTFYGYCGDDFLQCTGGTCEACGELGDPACERSGELECGAGLVVSTDGICEVPKPCGGRMEACCNITSPRDWDGDCNVGYGCRAGLCRVCGKEKNRPCSAESGRRPCRAGLVVENGFCALAPVTAA